MIQKQVDTMLRQDIIETSGLCSYYRRLIYRFAMLAQPLTLLTKKDMPSIWQSEQQKSFAALKSALVSAPVLAHPDYIICPWKSYLMPVDTVLGGASSTSKWNGTLTQLLLADY